RGVDAGLRRFAVILGMPPGVLEPQHVVEVVRGLAPGLTLDREAREVDGLLPGEVEGEQGLPVAAIRLDRELTPRCGADAGIQRDERGWARAPLPRPAGDPGPDRFRHPPGPLPPSHPSPCAAVYRPNRPRRAHAQSLSETRTWASDNREYAATSASHRT